MEEKGKKLTPLKNTLDMFSREKIQSLIVKRISTGMKNLDEALGGGIGPGLYILGAIPNLGKSTFALQAAENISAQGIPVLFFSMEMPASRIASKALSRRLFTATHNPFYSSDMLLNENSAKDETLWKLIEKIRPQAEKDNENLYIIERDEKICSAGDIVKVVEDAMQKFGPDRKPVVIVDYLQILSAESKSGFLSDRAVVDSNIRTFTTLATQKKIPVLVISAFNRTNYQAQVSMEAFKESGAIEYSADVILGMQLATAGSRQFDINKEKAKNPRDIELVVLKQRYGKSGNALAFHYYPKNDYFEEADAPKLTDTFFPELPERSLD